MAVVDYDTVTKRVILMHMKQVPAGDSVWLRNRMREETFHGLDWKDILRITTDVTGVGEGATESMITDGLKQTWGLSLNVQTKTDVLENLHSMLSQKRLKLVYDIDLITEMNVEQSILNKTVNILFSHPPNTHGDRLWALALACQRLKIYGEAQANRRRPVVLTGKIMKPSFYPQNPWADWRQRMLEGPEPREPVKASRTVNPNAEDH